MELSLAFIGWFFTLTSAGALVLGAALIPMLAAIWVLGLAGGIGVIRLQPWGRYLLELFCWALIVLLPLSAASRLYALRQQPDPGQPRVNWLGAIASITLILIPVLAICAATIVTLRSPEAMKAFS